MRVIEFAAKFDESDDDGWRSLVLGNGAAISARNAEQEGQLSHLASVPVMSPIFATYTDVPHSRAVHQGVEYSRTWEATGA